MSRDLQTTQLKLRLVQIRLSCWGDSVGLDELTTDDHLKRRMNLTDERLKDAEELFGQIVILFRDARKKQGAYEVHGEDVVGEANQMDKMCGILQKVAISRPKAKPLTKRVKWALVHHQQLSMLLNEATELVKSLEEVFPVTAEIEQQHARATQEEAAALSAYVAEQLQKLKEVAGGQEAFVKRLEDALKRVHQGAEEEVEEDREPTATIHNRFGDNCSGLQPEKFDGGRGSTYNFGGK